MMTTRTPICCMNPRARSREIESLVRRLAPICRGDWRSAAYTAIAEGYYQPGTAVGNVATTLRTAAQRLAIQGNTDGLFRDECRAVALLLTQVPASNPAERHALVLQAAHDLLALIEVEELVPDVADPNATLCAAATLINQLLLNLRGGAR